MTFSFSNKFQWTSGSCRKLKIFSAKLRWASAIGQFLTWNGPKKWPGQFSMKFQNQDYRPKLLPQAQGTEISGKELKTGSKKWAQALPRAHVQNSNKVG